MMRLRVLIRDHTRPMLVLLAIALAVRALVPAGFMATPGSDRFLTVTVCADASTAPRLIQIAISDTDTDGASGGEAADNGQPCAFTGLGLAGLGTADPLLLASALAFILLIGTAPLPALPRRGTPFLRPPLRGPPARA